MLVRQAVAGVVDHVLDAGGQLIDALDACVLRGHFRTVIDSVGEQEARDGSLYRVVALGQRAERRSVARFTRAVAGARQAHLADEARQGHDGPGRPFAVAAALRPPALVHVERLGGADFLSQAANAIGGDAGDLRGPLGGLLHHVVALAHDVGAVGHVLALVRFGHGLLVVAHAVRVQEVEVHHVVGDQLMGDAGNERGVGARVDGQPLVGVAHDGVVHAGVDHVDLRAGLLAQAHPVVVRGQAALTRFRGAGAEDQDKGGVARSAEGAATVALGTVHVRRDAGDLRRGIAVVVIQVAAHQVQHAVERTRRGCGHAGSVRDVHGLVAVLLDNFLELRHGSLDGLFPADLLPLALAALTDALHGVVEAVRAVHPATIAAAAQACARLRIVETGIGAGVGINPHNLVVLHVELQAAATRAVDGAVAPGDGLLGAHGVRARHLCVGGLFLRRLRLRRAAEQRAAAKRGSAQTGERRALHERAARQRGVIRT